MTSVPILAKSSHFYAPLRYPGGKGKLAPFVKAVIELNHLSDGYYAEPYAGGAAVALELLFHEYVTHVYINDISPSIGAFWRSVLHDTDSLCARIKDTRITMDEWMRQRDVLRATETVSDIDLGFATFFLNRTNRSGILKGGVIGGKDQSGSWKIDARYNVAELVRRIEAIACLGNRIAFSQEDALVFLRKTVSKLPTNTLVYLDPPYYVKGKDLYLNYYAPKDHQRIASSVPRILSRQKWMVSYDDAPEIFELYSEHEAIRYGLSYSAQARYRGGEVMFFSDGLTIPPLLGNMRAAA